ncbi:MAG: efflux RND transporter periplasmic adaptor subunit [Ferruginibacter sp.]
MLKKVPLYFFCYSLSVLVSCHEKKEVKPSAAKSGANQVTKVDGYIVHHEPMSESLQIPGSILPYEETEIHSEITGRVVQINFKEAGMVGKGALLIKLFDGDLVAQLNKLQVQLKIAQTTLERQQELLKIGGISQQDVDLSGLQASNIKADMDLLRISISKTFIRSPYAGKVGFRNVSLGAYVSPTTIITTLKEVNRLRIEFAVPGKYFTMLSSGKPIKFNVEGSPNNYFADISGTENSIADANRSLSIRATVKNVDKFIMPGAFAKINLAFDENPDAIMVPTNAILPQARNKQVIVSRNGLASFEVVQTGVRDSARVEITSGLKVGDTVVTTGLLTLKPKAKIAFNKIHETIVVKEKE